MTAKFITAAEAAKLIKDNSTVGINGFISFCLADDILTEIENRYINEHHPCSISVVNVAGVGGDGKDRGMNHLAHDGLMSRLLCSNLSLANKVYPLIMNNAFPTFMIPQGVLANMMRAITSGKPGVITKVGMHTFVDPRVDGGRINDAAKKSNDEVVSLITINGNEYLFYPAFSLDVAIVKGSIADADGNISLENEALHIEQYEMAAAAKNSGGIVMVQVDKTVKSGELHPQKIKLPAALVDYVIVGSPENSGQHFIGDCKPIPSWSGHEKIPFESIKAMPLCADKVICRRSIFELHENDFINLGIGISMDVSGVLNEEGLIQQVASSIESGVIGGVPAPGIATGAAYNPTAILKQPDIFDLYDGGGIDFACVGAAEIDMHGNVNVSRFAGKVTGPGGFINITQGAKTVCFLGTFTAGKKDIRIENGKLNIIKDGPHIKFKKNVDHITFSGRYSIEKGTQKAFYITERAVFTLTEQGLTLIETAPGIDIEKDIFAKMEFRPVISPNLKTMDERLFKPGLMNYTLKTK